VVNGLFKKPFKLFNILKEDKEDINNFINSELDLVKVTLIITYFKTIKARAYPVITIKKRIKELKEDPREDKEEERAKKEK
jgi:hypothetical protein